MCLMFRGEDEKLLSFSVYTRLSLINHLNEKNMDDCWNSSLRLFFFFFLFPISLVKNKKKSRAVMCFDCLWPRTWLNLLLWRTSRLLFPPKLQLLSHVTQTVCLLGNYLLWWMNTRSLGSNNSPQHKESRVKPRTHLYLRCKLMMRWC